MNEYFKELQRKARKERFGWRSTQQTELDLRRKLVDKYSWAIPNEKAIEKLVEYSPIIEVGAGNGYWAHLSEKSGADVRATDAAPWDETWTTVEEKDHTVLEEELRRSLFMCWPSYAEEWTGEAVEMYAGDTLIYVGEGRGGCTGNDKFHEVIDKKFGTAEEIVNIPQWYGIHDRMYIFQR